MNARTPLTFGMAALGLALVTPVHAASDAHRDDAFIVARQDNARDTRRTTREPRHDEDRAQERDAETEAGRDKENGYGYGYERRQQKRQDGDSRPRGRR